MNHIFTVAERAQRAANRKNTCKLRKLHQFDNTRATNAHNTTKQRNALQTEKNTCKLRKQLHQFDNTHYKCSQHNQIKKHTENKMIYLFVVWVFAAPAVKLMKMFSWFAGAFSICMCFLKLQHTHWTLSVTVHFERNSLKELQDTDRNVKNVQTGLHVHTALIQQSATTGYHPMHIHDICVSSLCIIYCTFAYYCICSIYVYIM